ncbi:MAG: GNAT family N-acetyltransferase [Candidatus Thorarchaeota archaeon]|nr:GNAT family N-acetyltransferase [Candidatus Thorarchaeota archaeon]
MLDDSIKVVKATPEDAEALAEISKRAFESDTHVGSSVKGGPMGYDSVEVHRRHAKSDWLDYLKILYKGKIVGGLRVYKMNLGHYEIMGVFIDPDYHRKGIGKRSFTIVQEMYPDAKMWTLDTPDWNIRTKNFYEQLGFVQYGVMRWEPGFELRAYELLLDPKFKRELTVIGDLSDGMKRVTVQGVVDSVPPFREVVSKKDGKSHRVVDAVLSDGHNTVKLVLWDDMIRQVNKGEHVLIEPGYVTSFRGELQLNVSKFGRMIILL